MTFAFDPDKSAANQAKHGIDFVQAQAIWTDPHHLEIAARPAGESRFLVIGQVRQTFWTAVVTYREETIRIISCRRARYDERQLYTQSLTEHP